MDEEASKKRSYCYLAINQSEDTLTLHWSAQGACKALKSSRGFIRKVRIRGKIPWRIEQIFWDEYGSNA